MYGFIIETNKGFAASVCQHRDGGGLQREEYFRTVEEARSYLRRHGVMRVRDYTI